MLGLGEVLGLPCLPFRSCWWSVAVKPELSHPARMLLCVMANRQRGALCFSDARSRKLPSLPPCRPAGWLCPHSSINQFSPERERGDLQVTELA